MTATYDPTLDDPEDRVRFLTGDTDTANAMISDEEITAVLALYSGIANAEAKAHLAAADVLSAIWAELSAKGRGIEEKQVSRLRIKYGTGGGSAADAVSARVAYLRAYGARLAAASSPVGFQVY